MILFYEFFSFSFAFFFLWRGLGSELRRPHGPLHATPSLADAYST